MPDHMIHINGDKFLEPKQNFCVIPLMRFGLVLEKKLHFLEPIEIFCNFGNHPNQSVND